MLIVAVLPSILFPPKTPVRRSGGPAVSDTAPRIPTPAPARELRSACPHGRLTASAAPSAAETIWVSSGVVRFGFSTVGGELVSAELLDYKSFAPGDSARSVQLVPAGRPLLAHCLIVGGDTISLSDWRFTPSARTLRVTGDSVPLRSEE